MNPKALSTAKIQSLWRKIPIISVAWISGEGFVYATESEIYTYDLQNCAAKRQVNLHYDCSVFKLATCAHVFKCKCMADHSEVNKDVNIIACGNKLCMMLTVTNDHYLKTEFSISTRDFICGACAFRKGYDRFLITLSTNSRSAIYSLSTLDGVPSKLFQTYCIPESPMLYCNCFIESLCKNSSTLLCVVGTSTKVVVWSVSTESPAEFSTLASFVSGKGIVFAVDALKSPFNSSCLLASAAEDRSVVVWSSEFDGFCNTPGSRFGHWSPLYRLGVKSPTSDAILFQSRIWGVRLNDWGIVTAGQDGALVCCPWPKDSGQLKPVLLSAVHVGDSIWCLDTTTTESATEMQIISGGNDGAVVLTSVSAQESEIGVENYVKLDKDFPEVKVTASAVRHDFPSDVAFENYEVTKDCASLADANEGDCIKSSPTIRNVFIASEGRVFAILESGDLARLVTDEGTGEPNLTISSPRVSPSFSKRLPSDAKFLRSLVLRQDVLFPGYCLCGVHRPSNRFALGGRWGCVGIYEIDSDGNPVCLDLFNVPPKQRVTALIWISSTELVVAMAPQVTVYIRLLEVNGGGGMLEDATYLLRDSTGELAWTTCAAGGVLNSSSSSSLRCVIVGNRAGGLDVFTLLPPSPPTESVEKKSTVEASWSIDNCHGRDGVLAVHVLTDGCTVLTSGRQHGRVWRWRLLPGGRLQALDQALKPSKLSWVASFAPLPSGEVLALGFIANTFQAVKFVPAGGEAPIASSVASTKRLVVECPTGQRPWDFSYDPRTDSLILAVVRRNSRLLIHRRPRIAMPDDGGFIRRCLIPPCHGRNINVCLMLPHPHGNSTGCVRVRCYTGSEDFFLGSLSLTIPRKDGTLVEDTTASFLQNQPHFHSGHISNIRCFSVATFASSSSCSQRNSAFLVSGGGQGMLAIWRLAENDGVPGLIGWACLDTAMRCSSGPLISCPVQHPRRGRDVFCRLRVMALLSFHLEDIICIVAGCSDGSIRLIRFSLPCDSTQWLSRFYQLSDLRSNRNRECILSLACLPQMSSSSIVSIAYSTTRGSVEGFRVDLKTGDVLESLFQLEMMVEIPLSGRFSSCAANDVAAVGDEHLVVAGDDGSIRLADVKGTWVAKATRHFAAVVKVASVEKCGVLLSLGADHRLLLWRLGSGGKELTFLSEFRLKGLGDPQNMSLLPVESGEADDEILVMICGAGLQLCCFNGHCLNNVGV